MFAVTNVDNFGLSNEDYIQFKFCRQFETISVYMCPFSAAERMSLARQGKGNSPEDTLTIWNIFYDIRAYVYHQNGGII